MRCCYYVTKRRTSLSGYLSILPHLAIPIGFSSQSAEPLTKDDEQNTTSTIPDWEDYPSTSKPYHANLNRNESLQCGGTLPTLYSDGATNSSHPQEESDLLAVNDDWFSEEILLNCNSEGEPDIPLLLHISDDTLEDGNVELTDDVIQEPFTSSDEQMALNSEVHEEEDCASEFKTHDVPQSSNTLLPSGSGVCGAIGNSHSHETPDSQEASAADDNWLAFEISQTVDSRSEAEVSYLLDILLDNLQKECRQHLEDEKLQSSVANHEASENVKCMIPGDATSEPASNAPSLHEPQASQPTYEKDFPEGSPSQPGSLRISHVEETREVLRTSLKTWRDNITQMKRALRDEAKKNDAKKTIEDSQLHRVPTSDQEASDQGRQSSAQIAPTNSSTTSLSRRNVHPSEKQHPNLQPGVSHNSLNDCGGSTKRINHVNILSHSRLLRKSLNDSFPSEAPAEVGKDAMENQKRLSASKRTKKRSMGSESTRKKKGSQYEATGRGFKRAGDDLSGSSPRSRSRIDGPIKIAIRRMYPDYTVARSSIFKRKAAAANVSPNAEAADRDALQGSTPLASFNRVTKAVASIQPLRHSSEWLQTVIQQPQHSEFAAKVKRLAQVWNSNWNTLQGRSLFKRDRLWPIVRRIPLWLRAIVTSSDTQRVSDDDHGMDTPSNSKSKRGKSRILRITTGNHFRHATMDGTYALTLYHLFGESEEGGSFVNTLLVPSGSKPSEIQQAWKEVLCFICQQLPREIYPLLADLEPFVFCSLIYSIVTENVDITGNEILPEKLGSRDFISFIVSHTKEFLRGGADLRMSQKQLEDLKIKCPWVSIVPSYMDQFMASVGDEQEETITDRMVFDLQKIACLFESIEAVSTTVSPNGQFRAQNARNVILESQETQVKEWLKELPNLLALSKSVQTANYGNWYHLKAQAKDLLVIVRRFQAWSEGIINGKAGRLFILNCSRRVRLRDFMDGLGLFARFLTFPKYVETFEELLILVSNLLRACKISQIDIDQKSKPYNFNDFMEAVSKSRKAQELLLCSTLYSILWKNLNFGVEEYFNYSVLEEEDLTAICNQAKKYLESLVGSTEADINLPEVDRARINKRLRRRA